MNSGTCRVRRNLRLHRIRQASASAPRDAFDEALREELRLTADASNEGGCTSRALSFTLFRRLLRGLRDPQQLRRAFALARRRAEQYPPSPLDVLRAAEDLAKADREAGRDAVVSTPRFVEADLWHQDNAWAAEEVEMELADLTKGWGSAMQGDRNRFRSVARLIVYNRHRQRGARSA